LSDIIDGLSARAQERQLANPQTQMTAAAEMIDDLTPGTSDWIITPISTDIDIEIAKEGIDGKIKQIYRKQSEYQSDTIVSGYRYH